MSEFISDEQDQEVSCQTTFNEDSHAKYRTSSVETES
jgi:hypothetical protein